MSQAEAISTSDAGRARPGSPALRVVAAGFIIQLVLWGGFYAFGVFLVPMSDDLGESRTRIAAVYTVVTLVFGIGSVISGTLTDKWGPRRVISICSVLAATGYALMFFVGQSWHAYLSLGVLTGIGLTGSYVPVTSTVARWFSGQRGMMMGIVIAGNAVGAMTGPPLMGMLIDAVGWRPSYVLLSAVILLTCLPAAQFMRSPSASEAPSAEVSATADVPSSRGTSTQPRPKGRLFSSKAFWTLCTVWALHGAVGTGLMVHYSAHMAAQGTEVRTVSLVLAVLGAMGIVGGLAGGFVGDRVVPTRALAAGFLLCSGSVALLLVASGTSVFLSVSVLLGVGWFGLGVLVPYVAATLVENAQLGKALGWLELLWAVGAGLGPAAMGWVYDRNGDYAVGLWLLLGLALVATALSLTLKSDATSDATADPELQPIV